MKYLKNEEARNALRDCDNSANDMFNQFPIKVKKAFWAPRKQKKMKKKKGYGGGGGGGD